MILFSNAKFDLILFLTLFCRSDLFLLPTCSHFPPQDEKLLVGFLRSTLVDIALYFGPFDSLKATFVELKRERRLHGLLLTILQDLVTHTSFQVRCYVGILLGVSLDA